MIIERQNKDGFVSDSEAAEAVAEFFKISDYAGKRVLLIIPDNTRSGPIGEIFQMIHEQIGGRAAALDCLVALGTHQPMTDEQICQRLCITMQERNEKYKSVKFFNHRWDKKETFTRLL